MTTDYKNLCDTYVQAHSKKLADETVISVFPMQAFMWNLLFKHYTYITECLLHHLV